MLSILRPYFEKLHLEVPFQNPREPLLPPSSLTLEKPHWDAKGRLLIGFNARMSLIKIQSYQSRDDDGESFPEEGFERWRGGEGGLRARMTQGDTKDGERVGVTG